MSIRKSVCLGARLVTSRVNRQGNRASRRRQCYPLVWVLLDLEPFGLVLAQQVPHVLAVDLQIRAPHQELGRPFGLGDRAEDVGKGVWDDPCRKIRGGAVEHRRTHHKHARERCAGWVVRGGNDGGDAGGDGVRRRRRW